jgi:hypothetical protein
VEITLEQWSDYFLKVKKIKYNQKTTNDIYLKTKYIQLDKNDNSRYVNPVAIPNFVKYFNIGETIPVSMVNDGIIFDDIEDAVEYAKRKHEIEFMKKLEDNELEERKKIEHKKWKEKKIYTILSIIIVALYICLIVFPFGLICIIMNTYKFGPRYAYFMITNDIKTIWRNFNDSRYEY